MNNTEKHLIFLPVCILVQGYERSVILDIQRGILDFIPNELYDIFQKYNKQKINSILSYYNSDEQEFVEEYIDFLIKNEYAILGTEHDAKYFANLSTDYNYCGLITNCVCEYSDVIHKNIKLILNKIDTQLFCSAFQLLCVSNITIKTLSDLLKHFTDLTFINHLEVVMPYSVEYNDKTTNNILMQQILLNKIIFYNAPFDKTDDRLHTIICYTKQNINHSRCGIVEKEYFTQNMFHITEAINHNTCLHKKLFIDKEGYIKNCPFSEKVFGNILNDDVEKIIKTRSFTKHWNITKDQIDVCRDCEFRYICTDCRVFIKDLNNIYSQPANCTYNPYIAKWQGEDGYISVEQSLKELQNAQ